jgi:hypothetical protein
LDWVARPLEPVRVLALGPRRVLVPVFAIAGLRFEMGSA